MTNITYPLLSEQRRLLLSAAQRNPYAGKLGNVDAAQDWQSGFSDALWFESEADLVECVRPSAWRLGWGAGKRAIAGIPLDSPVAAFAELRALAGDAFDAIDVDEFMKEIRGET